MLAGDDINVVTDVARCRHCNEVFALSALVQTNESGPIDLNDPPQGAWYQDEIDGFVVGATTRSPIAFFLVPFMGVWSGGALGGIYGSQIVHGQFNLFLSLFGIPFIIGTLVLGSVALMAVCGKVLVRVGDTEGVVFTGIGSLGFSQRFDPLQIRSVRIESRLTGRNQPSMTIVLDGPYKLRFGSILSEQRRDFIANVLRHALTKGK
jgi:hypothetical protein